MTAPLRAVIDIGSNAIRFVVYGGSERAPTPIYNEKASTSLGKAVGESGGISEKLIDEACRALARFALLNSAMKVAHCQTIATAAVRDASNGKEFLAAARTIIPDIRLLTGDEEAVAGGHGILAEFPNAQGIAADLGGGSLELIRLTNGTLEDRVSVPMGTMRLKAMGSIPARLADFTKDVPQSLSAPADELFLIGGAWRAMAKFDHILSDHPLPLIANHRINVSRLQALADKAKDIDDLKSIKGIPQARLATLSDAIALASALAERFSASHLIVSTSGIREGLLFGVLPDEVKRLDPIIESVRYETAQQWRFPGFGDALFEWCRPLNLTNSPRAETLLRATCYFADTAWAIQPDFRPIHAARLALDGLWHGLLPAERIQIAYATFVACSGKTGWPEALNAYVSEDALKTGKRWGAAIRLAKRISAGEPGLLAKSLASQSGMKASVDYTDGAAALNIASVERRLKSLSQVLTTEGASYD